VSLIDVDLQVEATPLPGDVRRLIRVARRRIERFRRAHHVPGFVPCDFEAAYGVLRALAEADPAPGRQFCEWGSGFGTVACLAALLDFDAHGIEIEADLVDAARQLADDFGLPVEFIHDSFLPADAAALLGDDDRYAWLTDECGTRGGREPGDFDVIFAYPWPDEQQLTEDVFARFAGAGAVLVTCDGDEFRVRRKAVPRARNS
jgi:hypothetical protein